MQLSELRGIMSLIGWLLMIINMMIGLIALIVSIICSQSMLSQPRVFYVMLTISIVIGLMASIDMTIAKRLKRSQNNLRAS